MSKFIKPATLTVPKEIYDFLSEIDDYCAENDIYISDMVETIINKGKMGAIEITYEK